MRLIQWLKARFARPTHHASGGSMFVGAVDEVELGAPFPDPAHTEGSPESDDPEHVRSEHAVVNDLRDKLPYG